MTFSIKYPSVTQWVSYHGTMAVAQASDGKIEVSIGDAGGVSEDGRFRASTIDEALMEADQLVSEWLKVNKTLLDSLVSGEMKDTEYEFICVAGWPPVRNPFYEP